MRLALVPLMALMLSGAGVFAADAPCSCDKTCKNECPNKTCKCECGCNKPGGKCVHEKCHAPKAEKK